MSQAGKPAEVELQLLDRFSNVSVSPHLVFGFNRVMLGAQGKEKNKWRNPETPSDPLEGSWSVDACAGARARVQLRLIACARVFSVECRTLGVARGVRLTGLITRRRARVADHFQYIPEHAGNFDLHLWCVDKEPIVATEAAEGTPTGTPEAESSFYRKKRLEGQRVALPGSPFKVKCKPSEADASGSSIEGFFVQEVMDEKPSRKGEKASVATTLQDDTIKSSGSTVGAGETVLIRPKIADAFGNVVVAQVDDAGRLSLQITLHPPGDDDGFRMSRKTEVSFSSTPEPCLVPCDGIRDAGWNPSQHEAECLCSPTLAATL